MQLEMCQDVSDRNAPQVMGILNVTPDSFSDGGLYLAHEKAVEHALQMLADGADIIDIGGESTRPGAAPVAAAEEIDRVVGVIEGIRKHGSAPVSIDTSKPEVMRAAVEAGATLINDVRALTGPGALQTAAELNVPVCLMHMQGEPLSMQDKPEYADVVNDVLAFLLERAAVCESAGMRATDIIIDPGFGFGKTLQHNVELLLNLDRFVAGPYPVLAGLSRKSMIPKLLAAAGFQAQPAGPSHRTGGSVMLAVYAARKGAHILRVHDVRDTVEALTIDNMLHQGTARRAAADKQQ